MTYHIRVRAGGIIIDDERVLLVEFDDESGLHYNLPAGGVEKGEDIINTVKREVKEETSLDVVVGELAFVYEHIDSYSHSLSLFFECTAFNSTATLPPNPDPHQTDVKWISLSKLDEIVLYPSIQSHIKEFAKKKKTLEFMSNKL